ncbi:MAG: helix-turn-helix domain-containing protein [Ruminococcaceae bacterium]|nr:helix-turn-helix domain-containing protein [Oscillospiraceae bacterium]
MQANLKVNREKTNKLELRKYPNAFCLMQFHSQIEIFAVTEGEMEMLIDGKRKTLKKGEFSVVMPYVAHEYKTPNSSETFCIIIPTFLCKEFLEQTKEKKLKSPFFSNPKLFKDIKYLFDLMNQENASELRKFGIVNLILGYILENGEFVENNQEINTELISNILLYINDNFKTNISPTSISEHFGYSLAYVSHLFKTSCGTTLKRYITILRLKNALSLMRNKENSITFCAFESGFTSMRTFYRSFQNEFDCSPKSYLEKM